MRHEAHKTIRSERNKIHCKMKHLKLFEQKEEARLQKAIQKKLKTLSKEGQEMFMEDIITFIRDY